MNDLSSRKTYRIFRMRGFTVAAISVLGALGFAVADNLTGQLIPKVAEEIQEFFSPPSLLMSFTRPVKIEAADISIRPLPNGDKRTAAVVENTETYIQIKGPSGEYQVQFTRQGKYLPTNVSLKRAARVDVDTSDIKWIPKDVLSAVEKEIQPPAPAPSFGNPLRYARWSISQSDIDQIALAPTPISRLIATSAIREVGTSADDPEGRDRILQYWNTLPMLRDNNKITSDNPGPWGGAFLAWVMRKANVSLPPSAAAYDNWLKWGTAIPISSPMPGQIALFRTKVVPGLTGNYLVGIVLRKLPDCTEIITGNIARRVVIACVALPIEALRKAE